MELGTKNCFQVQKPNLRALGITLSSEGQFKISKMTIVLGFIPFFLSFGLTYGAWENMGSLEKLSEAMAPNMTCSLALIKLFTFIAFRSSLTKLLQQLCSLTQKANEKEFSVIIEENKNDTKISKFYTICGSLSSTLAAIAPLIFIGALYLRTGEFVHILPFEGNFLLDVTRFHNYCFIYAYHVLAIYIVGFSTLSFDTLFSWYIHNIVAHFRVIQEKLTVTFNTNYDNSSELEHAIRSVIIYHQNAIAMAKEFDKLYKPIIFAEFSFSSLQLCLIAFQLVHGVAWAQIPFLVAFLVVVYTQMIIYCIGGQRLQTESLAIATKFYEAIQWTHVGKKYRKMLLLPILRAQKPCTITAVFFEIKLGLFVEVVKTAGSYVALMKTLEEGS